MTRDLAALAQVWRDLAAHAHRRGTSVAALLEERYGTVPEIETETETEPRDRAPRPSPATEPRDRAPRPSPATEPRDRAPRPSPATATPLPAPSLLLDRFATLHGLELLTVAIDIRPGDLSRTFTAARGMISATYARGADDLATLALALHEFGHALLRAQLGTSVDPPRWRDEAAAAWAVRALEDPALVADPVIRAEAARRRLRREAITARLAAFESAVITAAGAGVRDAFPSDLDPAAYPALFDEPGVMASYAAADRWPQPVVGRKVKPP